MESTNERAGSEARYLQHTLDGNQKQVIKALVSSGSSLLGHSVSQNTE